jgi:predicted ATP-grasp superfamily ATP-dependent carboligase
MDHITEDLLSGDLIPVLLGFSQETVETARRMYQTHRVLSHVFCDRIPLPMRLSLCMKFHTLTHTTGDRLMVEALEDFASRFQNTDVLLYLIPCTEAYANLVWRNRTELESRYVIADLLEMQRVWFGNPVKKEEQK